MLSPPRNHNGLRVLSIMRVLHDTSTAPRADYPCPHLISLTHEHNNPGEAMALSLTATSLNVSASLSLTKTPPRDV